MDWGWARMGAVGVGRGSDWSWAGMYRSGGWGSNTGTHCKVNPQKRGIMILNDI